MSTILTLWRCIEGLEGNDTIAEMRFINLRVTAVQIVCYIKNIIDK